MRATAVVNKEGACEVYRKIGERLVETCLVEDGIGIAAPQVGMFKCVFLIREFGQGEGGEITTLPSFKLYLNPKWVGVAEGGKSIDDEYCLSVPGPGIPISRFKVIEATWDEFDDEGQLVPTARVFEGREARILQHEHDHLVGVSIPQRYEMQNSVVNRPKKKKKNKKRRKK